VALLLVMALAFVAVAVRLTDVQVISTRRYTSYGQAELLHTVDLPAERGTIYGRSGAVLAMSVPETDIIADDFQIHDPATEARQLAPLLHQSQASLQASLSQRSGFVYVARQVSDAVAARIEALNLPGLTFQQDPKRFQPNGDLALPVLGQVNTNGVGYSGLEAQYNQVLRGRSGSEVVQLDPAGRAIPGGTERLKPAVPGKSLVLTLDKSIEYEAEQALSREIAQSHAQAGWAVVLDARTGSILAMPSLVAGHGGSRPQPSPSPLALTTVYEPGSVAKVATFAGALTEGLITPQSVFTVPPQIVVGGAAFSDAEPHGTEQLTATQILARSSNIGTIEIARKLGPKGLYHWLRAIGWDRPTGLSFPGESVGILHPPSTWSGSAMGSMPIGQDEAVTGLQIADSYNMVANGGLWVPPRLVRYILGPGGTRHAVPTGRRHRVISTTVARELTGMFEHVVGVDGTAPLAAVPGYTVAGKTGTAQIPSTTGPGYQPGAFMASFVGFVPAQHPALTIEVTLQHPTPIYGGSVAAPVFSQIAQYALRDLDIPPGSGPVGAGPGSPGPGGGGPGAGGPGTTIAPSTSSGAGQ
jgi:cell division protein FtsI (penicillin-binding protein 3)